ncbi:hypothetical protein Huta_2263 [Halorhabdus utahensis DSM 12940]|uniref:CARDB domain-containing protein n=1 Tax=Halorhabdus utahensis (strain DSM 12940 / JCM 11049 / AX-2) TaxID=519442 RepID=C7NV18_HALUD|nr:hypothetical protein [Halorhabdus utahensis]ACV12430.1 hypothetical protein Huta_2263 [Halorhabdus utahensis DSM 12940]
MSNSGSYNKEVTKTSIESIYASMSGEREIYDFEVWLGSGSLVPVKIKEGVVNGGDVTGRNGRGWKRLYEMDVSTITGHPVASYTDTVSMTYSGTIGEMNSIDDLSEKEEIFFGYGHWDTSWDDIDFKDNRTTVLPNRDNFNSQYDTWETSYDADIQGLGDFGDKLVLDTHLRNADSGWLDTAWVEIGGELRAVLEDTNAKSDTYTFNLTSEQATYVDEDSMTIEIDVQDKYLDEDIGVYINDNFVDFLFADEITEGTNTISADSFDGYEVISGENTLHFELDSPDLNVAIRISEARIDADVQSPPNFGVSIDSTNDPITEGDDLQVTATVSNSGDLQGDGTLELSVPNVGTTSTNVSVGSGNSTTKTLSVSTSTGDAGSPTATVSVSGDDSASTSQTVKINEQPNFGVSIDSTNDPITEGDDLQVTATVSNSGDLQGDGTLELSVPNVGTTSTNVSVGGGNSTTKTLSVSTSTGDAGSPTATVSVSGDDSASTSQTVKINEQPNFGVSIDSTNDPITEGDDLQVTATVSNSGDLQGDGTLELSVPNVGTTSTNVSVGGGNSTTKTLSVSTSTGDAGSPTATVSVSGDDSASTSQTVKINEQPNFGVSIDSTNDPITEGDDLQVTATVSNSGDLQGDGTLELSVPNVGTTSTNVSVGGGNSTTKTLSVSTSTGDAGSPTATVSVSGDDSASTSQTVKINEQPDGANFGVSIDSTNDPITEGDDLQVTATVSNSGDLQGDGTLELSVPNVGTTSTNVSVGGGNSTTKTLSVSTSTGDAGSPTATVSVSGDDSASTSQTVKINEATSISLSVTGDSITVGGVATVSIAASQITQITVNDLWTDWNVDASLEKGEFNDKVTNEGKCVLHWSSQQSSVSVPITVSIPERYVGGIYTLNLTASNSNETVEKQANLEMNNN